jgi:hypothetical protein
LNHYWTKTIMDGNYRTKNSFPFRLGRPDFIGPSFWAPANIIGLAGAVIFIGPRGSVIGCSDHILYGPIIGVMRGRSYRTKWLSDVPIRCSTRKRHYRTLGTRNDYRTVGDYRTMGGWSYRTFVNTYRTTAGGWVIGP